MVKKETTIPILLNIILENIDDALLFLDGKSLEAFLKDKKTVRACERSIEIIGDACRQVLERAQSEHFVIDDKTKALFKAVYGTRNFLSHGYDTPDFRLLYNILVNDISTFKETVIFLRQSNHI